MKAIVSILLTLGVLAGMWCFRGPANAQADPSSSKLGIIGVDEFMRNTDRYPGAVRVEGVVGGVKNGWIALIDLAEFEKCGVTTCAQLTLPVRWSGTSPILKQIVRVSGAVRRFEGKLVFQATALEVVPAPKKAGK